MSDAPTTNTSVHSGQGSLLLGMIVCWLLNMTHLGVAYLLFVNGDRTLPAVVVLVGAIGLLQVGYVVPIWFLLRRRAARRTAAGFALAAGITLLLNAIFWLVLYVKGSP